MLIMIFLQIQKSGLFSLVVEDEESGEKAESSLDSMKGILYLSESYSKIAYQRKPKNYKVNICWNIPIKEHLRILQSNFLM